MKCIVEKSAVIAAANLVKELMLHDGELCDLGARDEILRKYLPAHVQYYGVDIYPMGDKTIYSNIEEKIDFRDDNFDLVLAIDVLEHTNNIDSAIQELLRVTKGHFIINLPNELYFRYRLRFLFGSISNKFKVNLDTLDRHRWFFTLENVKRLKKQSALRDTQCAIYPFYQKSLRSGSIATVLRFLGLHSLGANSFFVIGNKTKTNMFEGHDLHTASPEV